MVSAADHRRKYPVAMSHITQVGAGGALAARRVKFERPLADDVGRDDSLD